MSPDARQWRDEIALREASLLDAARERARGELSGDEFDAIAAREGAELALARSALASASGGGEARPARVRRRRWLVSALVAFSLAAAVLLGASLAPVPRQPGASITGSITLDASQRVASLLSEAEADVANGDVVAALSAYQQVLALRRENVVALTQSGWLEFSAGSAAKNATLVKRGVADLEAALALAPKNAATRLYYAIVAAATPGDRALAKGQFTIFLSLHPSKGQLAVARPFLVSLGLASS